jgi:hypothetical protein
MKKTFEIIVFLSLTFIFIGCKENIEICDYIDQKKPLELRIGNQFDCLDTINVNSEKYRHLINWGKGNKENWHSTSASYNADIYVGQGNFRLIYWHGKDKIVIGFTDRKGNPKQYTKRIRKGELDFLKDKNVFKP